MTTDLHAMLSPEGAGGLVELPVDPDAGALAATANEYGGRFAELPGPASKTELLEQLHAGLTLRFFAALRQSADPAVQAVAARHQRRIELFEVVLRWQIEHSLDRRDGTVEIRSSTLSTETNSETQPWAAVGLLERGWA